MARSGGYFKVFWICISQSQSDAPVMDQPPNVARVVRHPERSSDQLGNQGEGPAVALQAVLGRLLSEQSGQPAEFLRREFRWSPGDGSPGERVRATGPGETPPPRDGGRVDAKGRGHVGLRRSRPHQPDRGDLHVDRFRPRTGGSGHVGARPGETIYLCKFGTWPLVLVWKREETRPGCGSCCVRSARSALVHRREDGQEEPLAVRLDDRTA